ncbi:MAG: NAD(P)H-dependent oxidoreductase subunit E [Dehalococcoidia bacterium]|nr:NAD(P)H-dependent oxidoreductase subunit E [Dehalococcoidia bacterium]
MPENSDHIGVAIAYGPMSEPYKARNDLLSFVKDVHRRRHGLSAEDIDGIASAWGATPSEVYGMATFYSFLGARPVGQNMVKVCRSTPCCMKHCDVVAAEVQRALGISNGRTTPDGRFSLMMVNCIGQCDGAPALLVNDDVYQNVAASQVRDIIARYSRAGEAGHA